MITVPEKETRPAEWELGSGGAHKLGGVGGKEEGECEGEEGGGGGGHLVRRGGRRKARSANGGGDG